MRYIYIYQIRDDFNIIEPDKSSYIFVCIHICIFFWRAMNIKKVSRRKNIFDDFFFRSYIFITKNTCGFYIVA